MADDPIAAILAEMTERERKVAIGYVRDPQDVPRLLAAVGAALALHKPEGEVVYTSCAAHVITGPAGRDPFRFDKMAECPDCRRRVVLVCGHCDCSDWPCATYSAVLAALTGKGGTDG